MSYKLTVCITETLQRLIEVDIDEMDGDAVESIRRQYLDGELLGIKLLDHLIIGDGSFTSLKEKDIYKRLSNE